MKRLTLLILTTALGLVDFAAATDQKQKEQPGTLQAAQSSAPASTTQTPTEHTSTQRQGCAAKGSKHRERQHDRSGPATESQIPQNQVEYGGGG